MSSGFVYTSSASEYSLDGTLRGSCWGGGFPFGHELRHGENVSDVDPFVYTDVSLREIRTLRVVEAWLRLRLPKLASVGTHAAASEDSPGFPSFVKLAELVARVDEARKGGAPAESTVLHGPCTDTSREVHCLRSWPKKLGKLASSVTMTVGCLILPSVCEWSAQAAA